MLSQVNLIGRHNINFSNFSRKKNYQVTSQDVTMIQQSYSTCTEWLHRHRKCFLACLAIGLVFSLVLGLGLGLNNTSNCGTEDPDLGRTLFDFWLARYLYSSYYSKLIMGLYNKERNVKIIKMFRKVQWWGILRQKPWSHNVQIPRKIWEIWDSNIDL